MRSPRSAHKAHTRALLAPAAATNQNDLPPPTKTTCRHVRASCSAGSAEPRRTQLCEQLFTTLAGGTVSSAPPAHRCLLRQGSQVHLSGHTPCTGSNRLGLQERYIRDRPSAGQCITSLHGATVCRSQAGVETYLIVAHVRVRVGGLQCVRHDRAMRRSVRIRRVGVRCLRDAASQAMRPRAVLHPNAAGSRRPSTPQVRATQVSHSNRQRGWAARGVGLAHCGDSYTRSEKVGRYRPPARHRRSATRNASTAHGM